MTINTAGFDRIRNGLSDAIAAGVERAADAIVDIAQDLVPVDTGALRDSIHAAPTDDPTHWQVIAGDDAVDYAIWVEWGTSKAAAQPFLTPASQQVDAVAEIEAEIRKLIS
jgi:HK97 gp10 family phage protein